MKLLIITVALLVSACTTGRTSTMAYNDLNHFRVDCSKSQQQLAFLIEQKRNTSRYDSQQQAVITHAIMEIRRWCPDPQKKPQGCVAVREDFGFGSSQALVCNDMGGPIKNRWEAEVVQ